MSDMFLGSQAPLYQNVCIRRRNKNGKILEERFAKNRITRLMLYGIGKFLLGQFNDSTPDKIYEFIPRYLALGSNQTTAKNQYSGIGLTPSVNDSALLDEFDEFSRIYIAERNMCKLNTKFTDPFIKVSIKTYVSSTDYDGKSIGEAGLFSKEHDSNCLARVCFPNITKNPGEVLDIQWDITLMSYGQTTYPEKLQIENGSKVSIPLHFTNKQFKEIDFGIVRSDNDSYNTTLTVKDTNIKICDIIDKHVENVITMEEIQNLIIYPNDDNAITLEIANFRKWYENLKCIFFSNYQYLLDVKDAYLLIHTDTFEMTEEEKEVLLNQINELEESIRFKAKKLDETTYNDLLDDINDVDESFRNILSSFLSLLDDSYLDDSYTYFYINNDDESIPIPFYFGNLVYSTNQINKSNLTAMLLFNTDQSYEYDETGYSYNETEISGNYDVVTPEDINLDYKIVNNRVYRKYKYNESWEVLDYFLYNGIIVNSNMIESGYAYHDNKFYKMTTNNVSTYINEYINYNLTDDSNEKHYFKVYTIHTDNNIEKSQYYIDLKNDRKIYEKSESNFDYTNYHLTYDGWWVNGDYIKLIPILTPSNTTDRSVKWTIQNKDIALINFDGVVTAWNIGETTVIASTSNDLQSRCIIDVVKDTSYVDIETINLDPTEATLIVDGDANQYVIITGEVYPLFATNTTLKWSLTNNLDDCVKKIELGNNQIKLMLNGSGNTGTGYLLASSQSGLTAQCTVRVLYSSDYNNDVNCDNDYHKYQRGN